VNAPTKRKERAAEASPKHETQPADKAPDLGAAIATSVGNVLSAAIWPLFALVVFLALRTHLRRLIDAFTAKIANRGTSFGIGSLVITAQQGDLEALRASFAQLRTVVDTLVEGQKPALGSPAAAVAAKDGTAELKALAESYMGLNEPDRRMRVRIKDKLGEQMGALVHVRQMDRSVLVAHNQDAYTVALAYAVVLDPRPLDTALLIQAGSSAKTKHARYAVARALGRLASGGMVSKDLRAGVQETLERMSSGDVDGSLLSRIDQTRAILATERG
jgi:hypothetical protein